MFKQHEELINAANNQMIAARSILTEKYPDQTVIEKNLELAFENCNKAGLIIAETLVSEYERITKLACQ